MSAPLSAQILPMQTAGTPALIERTYRESGDFQWVRETLKNAIEANATRVEFGIEWQAVDNLGVYRRTITDNGCGMTADELVGFFNTFGGGGKPIGGVHENFGVGSKTSLMPWNKHGIVVISWVDGDASMIWVKWDEASGEYGLKVEPCEGPNGDIDLEAVYDPYDDPDNGCDWSELKPDWLGDHGTVVVLLGNSPSDDTVEGDPNRDEQDIKGVSSYLNRRMWEFPKGFDLRVDELRSGDKSKWPPNEEVAHGSIAKTGVDRRTNNRRIEGARHYVEYSNPRFEKGELGASGTVKLSDRTEIDWYLWERERPKIHSYAAISGYIGALYDDELYDVTSHHSSYRSFGVSEQSVRSRLWLIVRPYVDPSGRLGVYPRGDRNSLLLKGGPSAGGPLPLQDWAAEFADLMPEEIANAIRKTRTNSGGAIDDQEWRDRLAERFGARWKLARLRTRRAGSLRMSSTSKGAPVRKGKRVVDAVKRKAKTATTKKKGAIGVPGGNELGENVMADGDLPIYRAVGADGVGEGMLAAWQAKDPDHAAGVVLLNVEHPVIRSVVEHWQSLYGDIHSEEIERDIIGVYGQVAVSKVAHSEHLKGILPSKTIEDELRSEYSLTMALLGLMAEDHMISSKIGGKYRKKRKLTSKSS